MAFRDEDGDPYFFNEVTQLTSWDVPGEGVAPDEPDDLQLQDGPVHLDDEERLAIGGELEDVAQRDDSTAQAGGQQQGLVLPASAQSVRAPTHEQLSREIVPLPEHRGERDNAAERDQTPAAPTPQPQLQPSETSTPTKAKAAGAEPRACSTPASSGSNKRSVSVFQRKRQQSQQAAAAAAAQAATQQQAAQQAGGGAAEQYYGGGAKPLATSTAAAAAADRDRSAAEPPAAAAAAEGEDFNFSGRMVEYSQENERLRRANAELSATADSLRQQHRALGPHTNARPAAARSLPIACSGGHGQGRAVRRSGRCPAGAAAPRPRLPVSPL
eukprot:SAG11_NODE_713_length_7636_cov_3.456415_4_plen_328_part_00